jgi:hypothetical protein
MISCICHKALPPFVFPGTIPAQSFCAEIFLQTISPPVQGIAVLFSQKENHRLHREKK